MTPADAPDQHFIRRLWTAIEVQQHRVSGARAKPCEELRKLRVVNKALLALARPMPLLDGIAP